MESLCAYHKTHNRKTLFKSFHYFGVILLFALGAGLGFTLALLIFSGVRSRVDKADIPETFKGVPATLIAASIVSVSFMSFSGMVEGIFG